MPESSAARSFLQLRGLGQRRQPCLQGLLAGELGLRNSICPKRLCNRRRRRTCGPAAGPTERRLRPTAAAGPTGLLQMGMDSVMA